MREPGGLPWRGAAWASLAGLALLVVLEATRIDFALARPFFDPLAGRFPFKDSFFATAVSHDGLKWLSASVLAWIAVSTWRPFGMLRRLGRRERAYLFASALGCLLLIPGLKQGSAIHCPWDLQEFGGRFPYLRLFDAVPEGWSRGKCFPAGHVSAAFAYLGGFFACWRAGRRLAWTWLGTVLFFGAWAGVAQQARGAHFLSHTLWTAWLCWVLALLTAALLLRRSDGAAGRAGS